MKKVRTVTFHRAQNYGSALQTYALQQFVCALGKTAGEEIDYKVIDIAPKNQERLYSIFKKGFTVKNVVKNTVAFLYYPALKTKREKFQVFLQENVALTNSREDAEYYISGSDQIWNVRSTDFESFYYLDFVKSAKKLSYAASFGPLKIEWENYDAEKYANLLKDYTYISTREGGSAKNVELLTGRQAETHVDPTLLLDREEWRKIQSGANYKNGNYILLYCLEPTKAQLGIVKAISKKLHLPVVITKYNNKNDIVNGFVKKYACGPKDFLSLIDNAALVLTSSFHGTAFSLIYRKKFFVLNGKTDNRICDILTKTGLLDRSLENADDVSKASLEELDFTTAERFLDEQRQKSANYLQQALEL